MSEQIDFSNTEVTGPVSIERINRFSFLEPLNTLPDAENGNVVQLRSFSLKNVRHEPSDFEIDKVHCFPALVMTNGTGWSDANQYLLSKYRRIKPPSHRTIEDNAYELAKFFNWCVTEGINYKNIEGRRRALPTYKYCRYLLDEIDTGNLKSKTAIRYMQSVQRFYLWLQYEGIIAQRELWLSEEKSISFPLNNSYCAQKMVTSTDLCRALRRSYQTNLHGEYIMDGRRLRPIGGENQGWIFETIKNTGNTEMYLSCLVAVTTGARLSAALTLREKHFLTELKEGQSFVAISIGLGTLVKNKDNKQMVITVPASVYRRVRVYIQSPRYKRRKARSKHFYSDETHQYLFLTSRGTPYYIHEKDENTMLYTSLSRGGDISKFVNRTFKGALNPEGESYKFTFHDLRATFGMNILKWETQHRIKSGAAISAADDFFYLLNFIRERMGHESIQTTEAYLRYETSRKMRLNIQNSFEEYLLGSNSIDLGKGELDVA